MVELRKKEQEVHQLTAQLEEVETLVIQHILYMNPILSH